jgi:hypothetical protein
MKQKAYQVAFPVILIVVMLSFLSILCLAAGYLRSAAAWHRYFFPIHLFPAHHY